MWPEPPHTMGWLWPQPSLTPRFAPLSPPAGSPSLPCRRGAPSHGCPAGPARRGARPYLAMRCHSRIASSAPQMEAKKRQNGKRRKRTCDRRATPATTRGAPRGDPSTAPWGGGHTPPTPSPRLTSNLVRPARHLSPPPSAYLSRLTSSGDAGTTSPPPKWPPPPPRNRPSDSTLSQDTAPPQTPSLARAHAGRSMHSLGRAGGQVADAGSGADGAAHTAEAARKHYRRRQQTRSRGAQ